MRRGQSTVEWMLLVAVLVVGLVVAAYAFLPGFGRGVDELGSDVSNLFAQGETDGGGDMR
jgi:hypothetical protein